MMIVLSTMKNKGNYLQEATQKRNNKLIGSIHQANYADATIDGAILHPLQAPEPAVMAHQPVTHTSISHLGPSQYSGAEQALL